MTLKLLDDVIADSKKDPKKYEEDKLFVLIIMTHGIDDNICDPDSGNLHLTEVYKKLSHKHFEVMKGKPKWVIIQACKGRGLFSKFFHIKMGASSDLRRQQEAA